MLLKTINEVIPTMKTGNGIFSAFTSPMWEDLFTASDLDIYFAGTYGQKYISPYANLFIDETTDTISGEDLTELANAIYSIRASEWSHLLADLMSEYNPIENTDAYETETITESGSGTDGNTRTLGNTSTRTLNTSTGNTGSGSTSNNGTVIGSGSSSNTGSNSGANNVFAFDSTDPVPHDTNSGSSSNTVTDSNRTESRSSSTRQASNTETQTGTITDADTGTITDAGNNSFSKTHTRNYRKHGNIGIMDNPTMLTKDTEFWKWSFIRQICEDICEHIALCVY